jgi:hypothetical protein
MTTRMHSRMRPLPRKKNDGPNSMQVGDPTANGETSLQARPHDPSGNEPNFDELIGRATIAAATLTHGTTAGFQGARRT